MEHRSYYIVDVTNNRALVAISHTGSQSNLYVSENLQNTNLLGVQFTLSLEDAFCYFPNSTWHDTWIQQVSDEAFADVYKVEGVQGIYIASKIMTKPQNYNLSPQHLSSFITFDHGRSWKLIKPPTHDVEGQVTQCFVQQNCSLHLSQKFSQLYPDTRTISILTSKSAPGIIVATGVLGKSLKGHYGIYVSTDAGVTWRQTLRDLYFFNMGDHGGILTAVKYYRVRGETRHILYSTDEGETWHQTEFHNEEIRLYGLMTEPGENTTIFTMFGSLPEQHQWIIVKLDLLKAFKYNCTKDDYKSWSPNQSDDNRAYIPCVMGKQITYQRRMPHSNCYNGLDFDRPISVRSCDCDFYDYECDFGFMRSDNGHCIRNSSSLYDPYKVPNTCRPNSFYYRTKGYRKIQGDVCVDGFQNHYLPEVIPCPLKELDDFLLFAQRERISRFNLKTNKLDEMPIKNLKNVIAVDFDMKNNCVYWADIALDTIGRQCFNNDSSEAEILVSSDLSSIEGMALDWISNTLYFVDGLRSRIELIRTDVNHSGRMRKTILGPKNLKKPRGIALHPKAGYMFWTDWSAEDPSVNRANLDGTNIMKLFQKPNVEWPNGITIDFIAERIYWVDARQDYIASSDLHGDFFKKIVSHDEVVSHPFAIAVFKDTMYWDDWKRNAIFGADKDNFKGVEILLHHLTGLMDLKVYAHGLQVGTNACLNNTCPYICVGAPKGKYSCLCPDGMDLKNGKCLCPGGVEPFPNNTCPKIKNTCSPEHFTCQNGFCIPKGWACDGEDDCGDKSDEEKCKTSTCPSNYFVCGDGKCLPQYWRCDFDADCSDGSDELNCPKQNCTDDQFSCKNGRCISKKWRCDGENDCRDGSDELNCTPPEPTICKNDEFQCKDGGILCLPPTWRCDGENDCRDGSDEVNCNTNKCLDGQFTCGPPSNRCIYLSWVCDGDKDCPVTGKDEANCTSVVPTDEKVDFPLFNGGGSNSPCQEWMFRCKNNRCIPSWWKCDNADDCGDGSDEVGCETTPKLPATTTTTTTQGPVMICDSNMFHCNSENTCILSSWVCDGTPDCPMGEDELNCDKNYNCTVNHFKCRKDGSCILMKNVCDGVVNCPDGSDEEYCLHKVTNNDNPATPSCSIGNFPCDGGCHPLAMLCDGETDCIDGYDELNCTNTTRRIYQVLQMGVDERGINETTLLLYWWIPTPLNVTLEFLPSINKIGTNEWLNKTWTTDTKYKFTNLEPYTKYNLTIYVRIKNTKEIFPPARYFIATTAEGVPSEPLNVTAIQMGTRIFVSWHTPLKPNGIITNYQIYWYPPLPPVKLRLNGNDTICILKAEFQDKVKYNFYVIAENNKYESNASTVASITYSYPLHKIDKIQCINQTNNSLTLLLDSNKTKIDGFKIVYGATGYPYIELNSTNNNITINELSPGVEYRFSIRPYKNGDFGEENRTQCKTLGNPIPEVSAFQYKYLGYYLKLEWSNPTNSNDKWIYGIYYTSGSIPNFNKPPVLNTTKLTVTMRDLIPCTRYFFNVRIIGPKGVGPLKRHWALVTTRPLKTMAPIQLTAVQGVNETTVNISWVVPCLYEYPDLYFLLKIHERNQNKTWIIQVPPLASPPNEKITHEMIVSRGGIYDISVTSNDPNAKPSEVVTYHAPPLLPPRDFLVFINDNGSYLLQFSPQKSNGNSTKYEILVSPGNKLTMDDNTRHIITDQTRLIYNNKTSPMYTFAVRAINEEKGFKSLLSETISKFGYTDLEYLPNEQKQTIELNDIPHVYRWIIGLSICGSIISACFALVMFIRRRRAASGFTRFTNSHYNTRSGAATFNDNNINRNKRDNNPNGNRDDDFGLEEDDTPQITGFSDDEPLVIA